jgi:EF-hand domain-containing family member B
MIFENIGYKYQLGKFNAIYNRAKEVAGSKDDCVCVRDFQYALSEMHQIE